MLPKTDSNIVSTGVASLLARSLARRWLFLQKIGTAHVIYSRNSFFNSEGGDWRADDSSTQHDSKKMVHILVIQNEQNLDSKRKRNSVFK
jgi:hypothetical protein